MMNQVSFLTQSKFFSPAFNSAIFDGPLRIYFSQHQESQAMRIYFDLQSQLKDILNVSEGALRSNRQNIFIMLYPTSEIFDMSFSADKMVSSELAEETLGDDVVLGIRGAISDETYNSIFSDLQKRISKIQLDPNPTHRAELESVI